MGLSILNRLRSHLDHEPLSPLALPAGLNYIAAFLTLRCNLRCPYCINQFGACDSSAPLLSGHDWLRSLNRITPRPDLPITLQGGEPSLHPDFYEILHGLRPDCAIDLLTNLQFDVDEFMAQVPATRLMRSAPYASIRVSYHPAQMKLAPLQQKVKKMLARGYSIGIWAVKHPDWTQEIETAQAECLALGIDFRLKEFLGLHQGQVVGRYRYEGAVHSEHRRQVQCRTTELLIGPSGDLYRCHSDLYAGRLPLGQLTDPKFEVDIRFRPCEVYGDCNPCDLKVKTNRFQEFGHISVEIRF